MTTQEKILTKALQLFNEKGIEYVGMRELATALDMRIGNVTYYFPTKDDLVSEIAKGLSELNARTIIQMDDLTMESFLFMMRKTFDNHSRYRCLLLSFVHIIGQNPIIAKNYKETQKTRNETLKMNLLNLQKNKFLKPVSDDELDFLVSSISLIARFWISEASVSFREWPEEAQKEHYVGMIARILLPYATAKGKKEVEEFLQ
ncbi:MAG TPA: TetR/AcrR family transcriptional regulator [Patescibacteria group bacterium]|nr:TetR/AcrR family transcriptional regulator [Patescibacteria group bacterium]